MKIMLSAFACEPGRGSEEGVGWNMAWELAGHHRVHVLTAPRHRPAIEAHLRAHPRPLLTFSYFDFSPGLLRLVRTSLLWQLYYYLWQCRLAGWAEKFTNEFNPDIVQHLTYGRYWAPSSLWKLGRPFVWGPLGGADNTPVAFLPTLPWSEQWAERIRPVVQFLAGLDPIVRATARHATVALASTPATRRALRALGCPRVRPLLQMAVAESYIEHAPPAPPAVPTFCCMAKLVGWKGHHLALSAFAAAAIPGARLLIPGTGRTRASLEALALRLGVAGAVTFLGNISHRACRELLLGSHALIHLTLHDQAPTVVAEAMALGVPVIALELAGVAQQLTPETGFLIPARNPAEVIASAAAAMKQLVEVPGLRRKLGENARRRVETMFTWSHKVAQMERFYAEALRVTPSSGRISFPPENNLTDPDPVSLSQ